MKSARFGISDSQWEILVRLLLQPIQKVGGKVWIFGSRARGDYQQFSDLDVLIEGLVPSDQRSSIAENLEESTLPFRVDLVFEPELADSYRAGIMRERLEIT